MRKLYIIILILGFLVCNIYTVHAISGTTYLGSEAITRAGQVTPRTIIWLNQSANFTGTITTFNIFPFNAGTMTGITLATFHGNGSAFYGVTHVGIPDATANTLNTYTGLSLPITAGDYIGMYFAAGSIATSTSGGLSQQLAGNNTGNGVQTFNDPGANVYSINVTISYTTLTPPNINVTAPSNVTTIDYRFPYSFNCTDNETSSLHIWYNLDNTVVSLGNVTNSTINSGFINSSHGWHQVNFTCQDGDGANVTSSTTGFTTLHWKEISSNFDSTANETTTHLFNFTVQTAGSVSGMNGSFSYANTAYIPTISNLNATLYLFNISLTLPLLDVNGTGNIFNWTYNVQYSNGTNSSQQKSATNTQTVFYAYYVQSVSADQTTILELTPLRFTTTIADIVQNASYVLNDTFNNVAYNATLISTAPPTKTYNLTVNTSLIATSSAAYIFNSSLYVTFNGVTKIRNSTNIVVIINQIGLMTACSASSIRILNFTYVDEETNLPLAPTNISDADQFNANFLVYMQTKGDLGGRNYSYNMSGSNSYVICMQNTTGGFKVDADINYFNTTYYTNSRWYYLRNFSVSNITLYYNLYVIPTSVATEVPILLKSADGISIASNYIVVALRQIIAANNTFVPVAMTITSSSSTQNGDFWLRTGNAIYKFNMYDNLGNLINSVPATTISGTQIGNVISPPLSLTLGSATLSQILGYIMATGKSCQLSGTSFSCSYNDTSSKIEVAWLTVMKVGAATMTQTCRVSNTSVPYGTLNCDLSASGNGSYYYQLGGYYPLATTGGTYWNVLDDGSFFVGGTSPFGTEGLIFAVILIIMLAMIGSFNPVVCIFMGITGMGISVAFGMVTLSQSSLIGIAAIGIIIAVKVRG